MVPSFLPCFESVIDFSSWNKSYLDIFNKSFICSDPSTDLDHVCFEVLSWVDDFLLLEFECCHKVKSYESHKEKGKGKASHLASSIDLLYSVLRSHLFPPPLYEEWLSEKFIQLVLYHIPASKPRFVKNIYCENTIFIFPCSWYSFYNKFCIINFSSCISYSSDSLNDFFFLNVFISEFHRIISEGIVNEVDLDLEDVQACLIFMWVFQLTVYREWLLSLSEKLPRTIHGMQYLPWAYLIQLWPLDVA